MTRDTHGHRLAEWAELVGGSVPDAAAEEYDLGASAWDEADPDRTQ